MLGDPRERLVGVGDRRDGIADLRQDAADDSPRTPGRHSMSRMVLAGKVPPGLE